MDFDSLFENIFVSSTFTLDQFILTIGIALLTGLIISVMDVLRGNNHSKSFTATLALLPSIVAVIILVVGNNIGAGIAVAGAFTLVKFRSVPGTAEEIVFIFLSMATGLLIGAGFLGYALLFVLIVGTISIILSSFGIPLRKSSDTNMVLKITIPEDLEYNSEIDVIVKEYTTQSELLSLKSVNMGTMFRLTYRIRLKDCEKQKQFIDLLRTRNGNLEVALIREVGGNDREL